MPLPLKILTPEEARKDHWMMMRLLAVNAAFGVFLGLMVAALIIGFDLGGIGSLIGRSANPILPVLLIAVPLALTFAASVAASAIWMMPYKRKYASEPGKDADDH